MILYGISTCDTCKTAQKALVRAGHDVTFRDVRALHHGGLGHDLGLWL